MQGARRRPWGTRQPCNGRRAPLPLPTFGPGRFPLMRRCRSYGSLPNWSAPLPEGNLPRSRPPNTQTGLPVWILETISMDIRCRQIGSFDMEFKAIVDVKAREAADCAVVGIL